MEKVLHILEDIKNTSSRNEKEVILKQHKNNELLRKVLYFVFNDFITTGLSSKKIKKKVAIRGFSKIDNLMEYLKKNNTGSDLDIISVKHYIRQQPESLQELYTQIATKSLKIGITAKTLNKIYGKGFIPEFNVMLASKFEGKMPNETFIITTKLDGIRCVCVKENDDNIKFFTRAGQPIEDLIEIEEEVKLLPDDYVYDGELLLKNDKGLSSEDLFRETQKAVRKDGVKKNVEFHAFDMIPIKEFQNGKSTEDCLTRKMRLLGIFKDRRIKLIKDVPMLYVGDDQSVINQYADEAVKNNQEGVMINLADSPYECKRTRTLLKVKKFHTADVRVLDIIEGTGKNVGKLGAVTVQFKHDNRLHECNCGSGFTDNERILYFNEPELLIGKIVEIDYFEISQNANGGYGLRFPTWKSIIRHDKDEISMH